MAALGFMKKYLVLFITIIVISFNVDWIINELPNSDLKLKVSLFLNKTKVETLISILNKTDYTNIFWIKDVELKAGIRNENSVVWSKTPQLDEFVSKAVSLGYQTMLTSKTTKGNWLLSGYKETLFLNEQRSKVKIITVDYSFGNRPEYQICNNNFINTTLDGQCYLPLSNSWFIYKYWFTYDRESEQT